jgi:tetratricopeptide (TPR) repeat protein
VYLLLGQFDEATPALEQSVAFKPSAHGYSNLASAYFGRRRFDRAVDHNRRAIELVSRDYAVWGNLGEAYYWADGKRESSREAYERAVELALEQLQINAEDYYAMGELAKYYAMLGEESQATEYLERALDLSPDDPDLQLNAAIVHARLGHVEDARSWLEKCRQGGITEGWITANPIFDDLG